MSLYQVQKLLFRLNGDKRLQAKFRSDRGAVLDDYRLAPEERQALERDDVGRLYAMGAHPLLLLGFGTRAGLAWPDYLAALRKGQEESPSR